MLVTTCPDCNTTFRISVGHLEQADGQVRCGRCATIFDANSSLREFSHYEEITDSGLKFQLQPEADADSNTEGPADAEQPETETEPEAGIETADEPADDTAEQTETADSAEAASLDEHDSEDQTDTTPDTVTEAPSWLPPEPAPPRRWPWAIGALLMALVVTAQIIHQHRRELVEWPTVGPLLSSIYGAVDRELTPAIDLRQLDLIDLTAVAESSASGEDLLLIETRLRNRGPGTQAYPYIFVRLLDRWQDTIAGRYFTPPEYSVGAVGPDARLNARSTADVRFVILDPGPSATGFELELCEKIESNFVCESDLGIR